MENLTPEDIRRIRLALSGTLIELNDRIKKFKSFGNEKKVQECEKEVAEYEATLAKIIRG